jgi:hypothetical protein
MLKEGIVTYKFKSEKNYDSIKFTGESISVASLKARVEEKRIRKRDIETGKKWETYELLIQEVGNKRSRSYF